MKKHATLLLIVLAALLVLVAPAAQAQDEDALDNLTALAEYAPVETPLFVAIRTDDGYIDLLQTMLDKVVADVIDAVPEEDRGDLDNLDLRDALGDEFNTEVRPWLGDTIAVFSPIIDALATSNSNTPLVVVVEVTDFDAAVAYFDADLADDIEFGDYERVEQEDGSIRYEPQFSFLDPILITEDAVLTGMVDEAILPGADARRLGGDATFAATLDALPADGYNIITYINPEPLVEFVRPLLPLLAAQLAPDVNLDLDPLLDILGEIALGFTIVEEQSFVIDIAMANVSGEVPEAIDMGNLAYAPADTTLLIHDNGLGGTLDGLLGALYELDTFLTEIGVLPLEDLGPLDFLGPDDIATFLTLSLEGTYGIDLDETLAWMDGDFLTYVRPGTTPLPPGITAELGFVLTTDNPEATADLVAATADIAMRQFNPATFEDGTLTVPLGAIISMPEISPLVLTSNDDVLVMGTGDTVERALDADDSVTNSENYEIESKLFIADTTTLWYIDLAPLREAVAPLIEEMLDEEDAALANALLGVLNTSSITASGDEDYLISRFTLTLSD